MVRSCLSSRNTSKLSPTVSTNIHLRLFIITIHNTMSEWDNRNGHRVRLVSNVATNLTVDWFVAQFVIWLTPGYIGVDIISSWLRLDVCALFNHSIFQRLSERWSDKIVSGPRYRWYSLNCFVFRILSLFTLFLQFYSTLFTFIHSFIGAFGRNVYEWGANVCVWAHDEYIRKFIAKSWATCSLM